MISENVLEMIDVTKTFPGVKALDKVSLKVRKGTIHALMGENGAGKSTLMKILVGLYTMDEGTIYFDGEKLDNSNIKSVLQSGISMIYQELNPINTTTVAENVFCGHIPSKVKGGFLVDRRKMNKKVQELLDRLEITTMKPTTLVRNLSMAEKQVLEIIKALSNNSKLIVMDEPTSAITEAECQRLFKIIRDLKAQGMSFVYISHKMDEVFSLCDDITIIRDGKFIATGSIEEMGRDDIIRYMVGRELKDLYPKKEMEIGETVLEVKNLCSHDTVKDVSFNLRRGEILGFAGLMGAGRTETMETIFGIRDMTGGEIYIDGQPVKIHSSGDAIKNKMAFLTEDRRNSGCFLNADVYMNCMILSFKKFADKIGRISHRKGRNACKDQVEKFGVKTTGLTQKVSELSGGNQQKLLLARWLLPEPQIIILDEPTRGIDVGSKHDIYEHMNELIERGCSIIMISSELPEILGMSDRIVVMNGGRITGVLDRKEATQEKIMEYAADLANSEEAVG